MPVLPALPPMVRDRRGLASLCLFSWRADDLSLSPRTGQTATFSRISAGAARDSRGRGRMVPHSRSRFEMVDLDGDGIPETAGLLLEQASANVCSQPENLSTWGQGGTPVLTSGQPDPFGGSAAYLVADDSGTVDENINIGLGESGDGTKAVSLHLRQGTSPINLIGLFDSNAATWRHMIRVTWIGGVPVLTTEVGSGVRFPVGGLIGGWWWCAFNAPGVVAANLNQLVLRPTNTVVSEQASLYVFGVQVEEEYFPTSYMGPGLTRAGEQLQYAIDFAPFEGTVYLDFIERGAGIARRDARIFDIGNQGSQVNSLTIGENQAGPENYGVTIRNASAGVTSGLANTHVLGDRVELVATITSDARVQIFKAINGGAFVAGAQSAALAGGMPAAWASQVLSLGGVSAGARSAVLMRKARVLPVLTTPDLCREAA